MDLLVDAEAEAKSSCHESHLSPFPLKRSTHKNGGDSKALGGTGNLETRKIIKLSYFR